MKLIILAMDESWHEFYRLALDTSIAETCEVITLKSINDIQVFHNTVKSRLDENTKLVIASLDPDLRQDEFDFWNQQNIEFINLIHPDAYICDESKIGQGVTIFKGAILYENTSIGNNTLILEYAQVSHDCIIAENCVIMDKVTIGGHCIIGKKVLLKSNSVLKENIKIGDNVKAEYNSAIFTDVGNDKRLAGNPAREKRN